MPDKKADPPPVGYPCFCIKKGDTYYLTTGPMLTYNELAADQSGEDKKKKGVKAMKKKFKEKRDEPHTFYEAVEFTMVGFAGVNTGEIP